MVHQAAETPYDRLMHVAGVPRTFWAVKREDVAFQTFKTLRPWAQDDKPFVFMDRHQAAVYDDLLEDHGRFAGMTVAITSDPTAQPAQRAASLVVGSVLARQPNAVVVWAGCTDVNQWGRPVGPADDMVPDLVVIDGLHGDPTAQTYEAVDRWRRWAVAHTVCLVVGTGGHPVKLACERYRFVPDILLYGQAGRSAKTYG